MNHLSFHSNSYNGFNLPLIGNDDQNVVYYGDGNGPCTFEFGWSVAAHRSVNYVERLVALQEHVPLSTDGWRIGFACSVDEECVSPKHCVNNQCHEGLNGDPCKDDNDCDSGRCAGPITSWFTGECKSQLENGQGCTSDSDCMSGQCNWLFRCV